MHIRSKWQRQVAAAQDHLCRPLQASRPAALIIRSSGSMRLSLGWRYSPDFCSSMTSCHSSQLTLVHYTVPQHV